MAFHIELLPTRPTLLLLVSSSRNLETAYGVDSNCHSVLVMYTMRLQAYVAVKCAVCPGDRTLRITLASA